MELILMIIMAGPIGWFIRSRRTGYLVYLAAFNFLFTWQSVELLTEWADGDKSAFGPYPKANQTDVFWYGVVNLGLAAIGLGLLTGCQVWSGRRRARRAPTSDFAYSAGETNPVS